MKLAEIAQGITAHLKRFEADPIINKMNEKYKTSPFYWPSACDSGPRIFVSYVSYQGHSSLKKAEALSYLEWLDAGNVGRHYEALRWMCEECWAWNDASDEHVCHQCERPKHDHNTRPQGAAEGAGAEGDERSGG